MTPITTLLDRENTLERAVLPEDLATLYGGDLRFPSIDDRTYVVGNFVSTLDGVVSFEVPGKSAAAISADSTRRTVSSWDCCGLPRMRQSLDRVPFGKLPRDICGWRNMCILRRGPLRSISPAAAQQAGAATERDCQRQRRRRPPKGGVPDSGCKCSYPYFSDRSRAA